MKLTGKDVAKMAKLREAGWSYTRIGGHFGVSMQTVRYHLASGEEDRIKARAVKERRGAKDEPKPWRPPPISEPVPKMNGEEITGFTPHNDGWDDLRRVWSR